MQRYSFGNLIIAVNGTVFSSNASNLQTESSELAANDTFKLILIGPQGVGKSSVAELVARRCRLALYQLDAHCLELYKADLRFAEAACEVVNCSTLQSLKLIFTRLAKELGEEWLGYQEHLHLLAVEQALENANVPILDMGSGHCSYTIAANQDRLARHLDPFPVLCLWPSRNLNRGAALLSRRNPRSLIENEAALRLHQGREIAKHTIYVNDKEISDVADEVISWMNKIEIREEGNGSR